MEIYEEEYKCPSFSSYSSNRLADIATEVVAEDSAAHANDDFEFVLLGEDDEAVLPNKFLYDGSVYPVFHGDFSNGGDGRSKRSESNSTVSLAELLQEDRQVCKHELDYRLFLISSSEDDELENVSLSPRPGAPDPPSPGRCRKSNSTGSVTKRWTLCDLLRRSNSEGKHGYGGGFVQLSPRLRRREEKPPPPPPIVESSGKAKGNKVAGSPAMSPSPHEVLYVRNRATKEGHRKKSFLPYRQDLVGFFVTARS